MIYSAPLSEVEKTVALHAPSHLISLLSPDMIAELSTPAGIAASNHLRLAFHYEDVGVGVTPPTERHVADLVSFAQSWDRRQPLLTHCYNGFSRSTAAVYIALCALNESADERRIAAILRQRAPHAFPHEPLIRLGDGFLKRGGRMIQAIAELPLPEASSPVAADRVVSYPSEIPAEA